ncbi:hypothetical protein QF001_000791 [Paraburkholderia youngii]
MTNHRRRQTVTEQMCGATARGAETGTCEGLTNNLANRPRPRQTNPRCQSAKEDAPRCTRFATIAEICCDCFSDLRWQRDVLDHLPLSMNDEFPRTPVNVVELDCDDFSGT